MIESLGNSTGSGSAMLERVVHAMIEVSFLPSMSWTGKGKVKDEKIALGTFIHVINFIKVAVRRTDSSFSDEMFDGQIKYVILKRAPSKYGKTEDAIEENLLDANFSSASQSNGDSVVPNSGDSVVPNSVLHSTILSRSNCAFFSLL